MPYYELIYEDGSFSLANYADDDEALSAAGAHHERATKGEPALLSDTDGRVRASRIVKVIRYEESPGELVESQLLPEDQVKSELESLLAEATKNGVTDLRELSARIRDLSNPLVASEPHESNYKADGKELELTWQS